MPNHISQQPIKPVIIGIAGRIGAGKTSVGKYLNSICGFFYIRYSQVLADWRSEYPEGKANLQVVGWEVMAGGMQRELNSRLIARIPPKADSAVDGLRHPMDYDCLREEFGPLGFYLFYIESAFETRWQRLRGRITDLNEFRRRESHAVEQHIPALKENAFISIQNEGSLQELYSNVDSALARIRNEKRL
jgi:dephospho-CoA kinase